MFFALQDEPEKGKRLLALSVGVVVAVALQGGGLFAARYYEPAAGLKKAPRSVVAIVPISRPKPEPPKPEPAPEPTPEPPKPEPPKPEPPKPEPPKPKPKPEKPKPKPEPPKPPPQAKAEEPAPPPKKPAPIKTGISFTSTDARGKGATMNAGNTQLGETSRIGSAPVSGKAPEGAGKTIEGPAPAPPAPPVRTAAKALKTPKPGYTRMAERNAVEGRIVAILTVGPDGKVTKVKLIQTLGFGLDEAAIESFMRWEYQPAAVDGKPVESTTRAVMNFVLEDG